jgi:hypothetical protein
VSALALAQVAEETDSQSQTLTFDPSLQPHVPPPLCWLTHPAPCPVTVFAQRIWRTLPNRKLTLQFKPPTIGAQGYSPGPTSFTPAVGILKASSSLRFFSQLRTLLSLSLSFQIPWIPDYRSRKSSRSELIDGQTQALSKFRFPRRFHNPHLDGRRDPLEAVYAGKGLPVAAKSGIPRPLPSACRVWRSACAC